MSLPSVAVSYINNKSRLSNNQDDLTLPTLHLPPSPQDMFVGQWDLGNALIEIVFQDNSRLSQVSEKVNWNSYLIRHD